MTLPFWIRDAGSHPSLDGADMKITYAKRKLENQTYGRISDLLKPFVLISAEKPIEIRCKVREIEDYMKLFLYLIDTQDC